MPTWAVRLTDGSGKEWVVGVKAATQAGAERWAQAWGHEHRPAVVVSARVMTPEEERQYGGVIDADAPDERDRA